jgi:hypothetical protein
MTRPDRSLRISRLCRPRRIALVTDFGASPYVGQIDLLLAAGHPRLPSVALISDLTPFRPDLAAYLLPALLRGMPERTLYMCVVDPGVGSERGVVAMHSGQDWFVAPDNGLLVPVVRRAGASARIWRVHWQPPGMTASFHGRDLFTPLAQHIAAGRLPCATRIPPDVLVGMDEPESGSLVCHIDHYGNAISGLWAAEVAPDTVIALADRRIRRARTFSDVPVGEPFWYENAFGLLEIAVNQGRADTLLHLQPGDPIPLTPSAAGSG